VNNVRIAISIIVDHKGKWVAFGRSDNSDQENCGVNKLLAVTHDLSPVTCEHRIEVQMPPVLVPAHGE
jgi:hypothetical protein